MQRSIDERPYVEFLAGKAVAKPYAQRRHAVLQARMATAVVRLAGDRGDVGTEWRFYMSSPGDPRTSLVPDVSFVSRERLSALTPAEREQPPISPDLAIEIRSPDDRLADVEWKMRAYLAMGGTLALDVLPDEKTIRAFSHDGTRRFGESDRFSCDAIAWLEFDVADVFANLD
jgi:Uma2 family endonuclease